MKMHAEITSIEQSKSTEEGLNQDLNTLEAQREAAEAYIRSQLQAGWTALADTSFRRDR
jgi:site-specific DNA recombinase